MSFSDPELGIVGAGAWGTALAILANRAGARVTLYVRNSQVYQTITEDRVNAAYLPSQFIDPAITVTQSLDALQRAEMILLAVPSQALRAAAIGLSDMVEATTPIIIASKGIEQGSLMLMSEVVQSIMPHNPIAILTGPNFAHEAASGLPTASVLATYHAQAAERIVFALAGTYYRLYVSDDPIGAQIGGAAKNVIAIASGIAHGAGLGENARAALLTRGIAEITRLSKAKGGKAETASGLSGLGDIMLSASSTTSRNFAYGVRLAASQGVVSAAERGGLVEGVYSAESITQLARKLGVRMPICSAVSEVISGKKSVPDALMQLLKRPAAEELSD
jgi:glycerol-3-phosphate dehydrogenase (NAD(P)+)